MGLIANILWLIFGILFATYVFFTKKYSYWKNRKVNYLEPTFPLGSVILGQHFKELFERLYKQRDESQIIGGYIGWKPILMPTSLDLIQNILIKDFNYFQNRGFYYNEVDDPLSAHVAALDGEKWKSIRAKLTPTFTSSKMKFMFSTMVEVSDRLHETIAELVQTECDLEISEIMGRYTTEIIGSCAFGIECNALKDPNEAFQYYARKFFEEPHLNTAMLLLATYYPDLARRLHITYMSKDVSDFFSNCVRETVNNREENNVRRNDFMDLLIQLKNTGRLEDDGTENTLKLTHNQIAAQACVFFVAGFETTKTTMTYIFYELAKHPDIQQKIREEIKETLAKHGNVITYEAMQGMTYMDKVMKETLRMHPPVVFNNRQATRDYQIPNSKIVIEKGTGIFIPVYEIHHDPEIYENPEVFDPERFSPEKVKERHPMAFLGFSDGPRNCIGARFGRMQIRIALVALLQRFRFKMSPQCPNILEINPHNIIMTPKDGVVLRIERI